MKYLGAHVSIAGGIEQAPLNAARIGATGFALFTKNQRQWSVKPLAAEEIAAFKANCVAGGFTPEGILPHDSYLINLGNPDGGKRANAQRAFIEEMRRAEALGLKYLNFHPGSGLGEIPMPETLKLIAGGIKLALAETDSVIAVIENTGGQGHVAGGPFAELGELLELVGDDRRCGVCIDTCHAYVAGYDWTAPGGYEALWEDFGRLVGFERLCGMHLNDTLSGLDSHLDRHAPLGGGVLGKELFGRLMADDRLDGIPLILETPEPELWAEEIAWLKSRIK